MITEKDYEFARNYSGDAVDNTEVNYEDGMKVSGSGMSHTLINEFSKNNSADYGKFEFDYDFEADIMKVSRLDVESGEYVPVDLSDFPGLETNIKSCLYFDESLYSLDENAEGMFPSPDDFLETLKLRESEHGGVEGSFEYDFGLVSFRIGEMKSEIEQPEITFRNIFDEEYPAPPFVYQQSAIRETLPPEVEKALDYFETRDILEEDKDVKKASLAALEDVIDDYEKEASERNEFTDSEEKGNEDPSL